MSIIGDHLRDNSMRGSSSKAQVDEAMRLADRLAASRVRRHTVNSSHSTASSAGRVAAKRGVERATAALRSYLESWNKS